GTLWAWGDNAYGQLGNGLAGQASTLPIQVSGLSGLVSNSTGYLFSMALTADGKVWSWGLNTYGQLGDGTNTQRLSPVRVSNLTGVTATAGGSDHAIAL